MFSHAIWGKVPLENLSLKRVSQAKKVWELLLFYIIEQYIPYGLIEYL